MWFGKRKGKTVGNEETLVPSGHVVTHVMKQELSGTQSLPGRAICGT